MVIKVIDNIKSCSQVLDTVRKHILSELELSEKAKFEKEAASFENKVFKIIWFLFKKKVILLVDTLYLENKYISRLVILSKSKEAFEEEFNEFITNQVNNNHLFPKAKNEPFCKEKRMLCQKFFRLLNSGTDIYSLLTAGPFKDQRRLVYMLWLFGHYKGYIARLYELPVVKTMPDDQKSSFVSN